MPRPVINISILSLCAAAFLMGQTQPVADSIKLNSGAFQTAKDLIAAGRVVNDKRGSWFEDQPKATQENQFIHQNSIEEYARWHLGFDESHTTSSKAAYKFPYGDFKAVHRCALIAVIGRARQHGYTEIEKAARELLALLEETDRHAARGRRDELASSHKPSD